MKLLAILFSVLPLVNGHEAYLARIPNPFGVAGFNALGHSNPGGGGPRNNFGQDFAAANLEWTLELCQMDSDGDQLTNGQELGDPCCQWAPTNGKPLITAGLSHPGVANSTTTNPALTNPDCPSSDATTFIYTTIAIVWTLLVTGYAMM